MEEAGVILDPNIVLIMGIRFIQAKKEDVIICLPEEIKNMLIKAIVEDVIKKNDCQNLLTDTFIVSVFYFVRRILEKTKTILEKDGL